MTAVKHSATKDSVAQRIRIARDKLYPGELAVVNKLLENYPVAGLDSVLKLASEAGVSGPTVLRLVGKLGYPGYAAFQQALRTEVSERLFTPVDYYPSKHNKHHVDNKERFAGARNVFVSGIQNTFDLIDSDEFERVVDLLSDSSRSIITIGGRFSSTLATHLGTYLAMLRPGVQTASAHPDAPLPTLLDIDKKTVAVLFDYRRYQSSTVDWGLEAVKRGAHIVLLTDQYLSPLATRAQSVLTNSTAGVQPFDSMVSTFALVEMIISSVAERLGNPARTRLADYESIRIRGEGRNEKAL